MSANATLLDTSNHVQASVNLTTTTQTQANSNSEILASISSTVDSISSQLAIAMEAAASVNLYFSFLTC